MVLPSSQNVFGSFDTISVAGTWVTVTGWALDPNAPHDAVGMWWGPIGNVFNGGFPEAANRPRPDVAAAYPGYGSNHGFTLTTDAPAGTYAICVGAVGNKGGAANADLGCKTVTVNHIFGNLDSLTVSGRTVTASGWALDPNTKTTPVEVILTSTGYPSRPGQLANKSRPDVGATYPGYGDHHGFTVSEQATPGTHSYCRYLKDVPLDTELGCAIVVVN